ncbi:hypothetical protein DH2020_018782 [Rehmannia glutinosa]|uniref:RNase H type-1 domain-containing protein n=1 Tax=Rehmannia glutinosa TaxID=99300 RepID=A0ABR0WPD0_REHGL
MCWCWEVSKLKIVINDSMINDESVAGFMEKLLSSGDQSCVERAAMIMWNVWKQRNSELWDKSHNSPAQVVVAATGFLHEWRAAKGMICVGTDQCNSNATEIDKCQWSRPEFPFLKCNVDASVSYASKQTGIGMVLRNDRGEFLVARTITFPGTYQIREAELIGLREILSWIFGMGLKQVIFESDAKVVIDNLRSVDIGESEYDAILNECRIVLNGEPDFSMSFVRRGGNMVAHELAKCSFSFANPSVWTSPPLCIDRLLLVDVSD